MSRKLLINIHLTLAAFFAPVIFLVAVSGGLYLFGVKGDVEQTSVFRTESYSLDTGSENLEDEVRALFSLAGIEPDFQYLKSGSDYIETRPSSRRNYVLKLGDRGIEIVQQTPTLQKRLIELHKGHGPVAFKVLQQFTAVGLFLIVAVGLWLGLAAGSLRRRTLITAGLGTLCLAVLVLSG